MAIQLYVQEPARRPMPVDADVALILVGDNWNDFGYQTQFMLWYKHGEKLDEVGAVRILKEGQGSGRSPLPIGVHETPLPESYVSLGNIVDYYIRLIELGIADLVCAALNDLTTRPDLRAKFRDEDGLRISLYRSKPQPEEFYDEVSNLLTAGDPPPEEMGFGFSFIPPGADTKLVFQFGTDSFRPGKGIKRPSHRVSVLIGANGVGKTSLLARIARVAYAPPSERVELVADGEIADNVAFPQIIAVSYSPFDNFAPPDLRAEDMSEVARQVSEGQGRYVYLGLRDLATVFGNEQEPTRLIGQEALANAFADYMQRMKERERLKLFAQILEPVLTEDSFRRFSGLTEAVDPDFYTEKEWREEVVDALASGDPRSAFLGLSSGHKIVLHQLAGLTALLQHRALVLIDEPELHLHPPLLAALMSSLRRLLERQKAYAIVSTHSPVVVQETLASQVTIIAGRDPFTAYLPEIESYGENVGSLTREIFGFHPTAGDYRDVLSSLAESAGSVEGVERELGAQLSGQALAHVVASLARRGEVMS